MHATASGADFWRPLVVVARETPLHLGHLRHMVQLTEMGGIILPPMPAFYHRPRTLDDIINQTVNRVLDVLDIELPYDLFERWTGPRSKETISEQGFAR